MSVFLNESPIIACSSGTGPNVAISVIRISFQCKISLFQKFFSLNLDSLKPRYAHYTDFLINHEIIDKIVLLFFKGPHSFNGENILELHVHGNQIQVQRIIDEVINQTPTSLSLPGEFTYRALKNKKLSLSQVEGLDLLLNANSEAILKNGIQGLNGDIEKQFQNLFQSFLKLKTSIELNIDFSEDIGEEAGEKLFKKSLQEFTRETESLYLRAKGEFSSLFSPNIVLAGKTNAGKSSLFNALLGQGRAIVSETPGTTRDYISENLFYQGVHYRLIDTAGFRFEEFANDLVEQEGILRGVRLLKDAFFKILVINPNDDFQLLEAYSEITFDLVIFSHADSPYFLKKLVQFQKWPQTEKASYGTLIEEGRSGPIGPVENNVFGPIEPFQDLKEIIGIVGAKFKKCFENDPILIQRQRMAINKICLGLRKFNQIYLYEKDIAILSSELSLIERDVEQLIGVLTPDDILDDIFNNFCIGK